jgi:CheY-like chemotaxis protein
MLKKYGFEVVHVVSAEAALDHLQTHAEGALGIDLVLTDVNLKGDMTGGDLLDRIRNGFGYAKGDLPVLVMTGDDNASNQAALLRAGANDLVHKPIEERLLVTKLQFQLQVSRHLRARSRTAA